VNVAALRNVSLFAEVPVGDLEELTAGLRRRRYARGQVIFTQGDPGANLCIVEEGRVRIVVSSDDGKELTLRVLGPGEFFGELALLDGEPRSADAVAQEPCQLLLLQRDDFLRFVESRPRVAIALLSALSRKLRFTTRQAQDVAFLDVPARVARTLLHLADTGEPDGQRTCRLTQAELAATIGVTRESVNRWLGYFAARGLIRPSRGAITILHPDRLRRHA
jgi:CRP/FNR family cyclic AMP-dependent transcriptional regulator